VKTSFYLPDDLYAELKEQGADISRIARSAMELWLDEHRDEQPPSIAEGLRAIEWGVEVIRKRVAP
jgi:post-segregation antitoxin (ccd killing protein)